MLDFLRDPIWQFIGAAVAYLGIIVMLILPFCTLAYIRRTHVNILPGLPGIKAQSTNGWRKSICQPLNGTQGHMKASVSLVV